ncbi:MAG: sulfatase [Acidobacteriota bacterium]|nr:MAG: sulfatase [Acidobacteriota bacterium]
MAGRHGTWKGLYGTGVLLLALLSGCGQRDSEPPSPGGGTKPPNLVLISIDTLRADHLGCYGYPRNTSPNIDALARNAVTYRQVYSTSAKTAESHMSMFTSLYPTVHKVETITEAVPIRVLDTSITTLAEILTANGYVTVGFHGGGFVEGQFGFDRGFERYEKSDWHSAREWILDHGRERPFFLFFHTYRVHDPYTPSPPYDRLFSSGYDGKIVHDIDELKRIADSEEWSDYSKVFWNRVDTTDARDVARLVDLYDGAIAQLDADLGRLFGVIDEAVPETIIIITSDHGEEFGEHGKFTHQQLYNEILHVPLVIRHPHVAGGFALDERVSLVDLAPTILDMLALAGDEQFQGRSFWAGRVRARGRTAIFSELPVLELSSLMDNQRKVMVRPEGWEYYELASDPREQRNLGDGTQRPLLFAELEQKLDRRQRDNEALAAKLNVEEVKETLDEATIEQLRQLGYIQ